MNNLKHEFDLKLFSIASKKFNMGGFSTFNDMCYITYVMGEYYKV